MPRLEGLFEDRVKDTGLIIDGKSKKYLSDALKANGKDSCVTYPRDVYVKLSDCGNEPISRVKEREGGVNTSLLGRDIPFLVTHYGEAVDEDGNVVIQGFHVNKRSFDGMVAPDGELVSSFIGDDALTLIYASKLKGRKQGKKSGNEDNLHWHWYELSGPIELTGKYVYRAPGRIRNNGLKTFGQLDADYRFEATDKSDYVVSSAIEEDQTDTLSQDGQEQEEILRSLAERGRAEWDRNGNGYDGYRDDAGLNQDARYNDGYDGYDATREYEEGQEEAAQYRKYPKMRSVVLSADLNSAEISEDGISHIHSNDNEKIYFIQDDNPTALYAKDVVYSADLNSARIDRGNDSRDIKSNDDEWVVDVYDDNPTAPYKSDRQASFVDRVIAHVDRKAETANAGRTFEPKEITHEKDVWEHERAVSS